MKYWLMAVSSAESTSCRTWTTSSLPFMRTSSGRCRDGGRPVVLGSYPGTGPGRRWSAAPGQIRLEVRQTGGASRRRPCTVVSDHSEIGFHVQDEPGPFREAGVAAFALQSPHARGPRHHVPLLRGPPQDRPRDRLGGLGGQEE